MSEFTRHNFVDLLGYRHDSRWLLKLRSHPLVNCNLPNRDYNKLLAENQPVICQPLEISLVGAVSLLEALGKNPITPVETVTEVACYFADKGHMDMGAQESADNLEHQIAYLKNAMYRASHLRLL